MHNLTDRPVSFVGFLGFWNGIKIDIDNFVQITSDDLRDCLKLVEIENFVVGVDKHVDSDGRQVAHGDFVGAGILDDLGAQVAAFHCAQVLMIGFSITVIFVEHVRRSGLHLRCENFVPHSPSIHLLSVATFTFVSSGNILHMFRLLQNLIQKHINCIVFC